MSPRSSLPVVLAILMLAGCSRQAPLAPIASEDESIVRPIDLSALDVIERATRLPVERGVLGRTNLVRIPAGSVDALGPALSSVGAHGFIVLESGVHHESGMVEVTQPVTIIGLPGAVLESSVATSSPSSPSIQAALWVHGTMGFVLRDVEMRPAGGLGGTAILLENSPGAAVFRSNLHDYQFGVLVESSDYAKLWDNRIATTLNWTFDPNVPEAHGIVVINGLHAMVVRNQVSNALFGIWACSQKGIVASNHVSGNFVGLILCRVPQGSYALPSGAIVGAATSAEQWLAQENVATGNFTTGILIIDGANGNRVISNESHDNGSYAVEFTTDTYRFGFLTPGSFNNLFVAGEHPDTQVKNCGVDNRIYGGVLVDNALEPCN